jgi:hypothetical protein
MTAFSDYLENELLDHALGTASYTAPAAVYVALATASFSDANTTANEVSATGTAYARQAATFTAASGGSASTSATITFPTATDDWGTITHFGIYDASTAGNLLYHGALTSSKVINNGDTFEIQSGNLTVSHD